jgi:hypothetical protein
MNNQTLPSEQQSQFQSALEFYYSGSDDETANNFFYQCARALIKAHEAGESLLLPLAFAQAIPEESDLDEVLARL